MIMLLALIFLRSVHTVLAHTDTSTSSSTTDRWDWTGCNPRDLCECKLHGEVGGVKGSDIAEECKDNGYAVPKLSDMSKLYDAVQNNRYTFQCDTLKLNAFCFSQNGCLSVANKASCNAMKGTACDVDCNSTPRQSVVVGMICCATSFLTWILS
mmetsp:Transcript_99956/g.158204  ORF Transcript_99956/g.158204 Transcript_99956/m.158204 type:complete len:154 (-) Transcript_99956:203-664(-)